MLHLSRQGNLVTRELPISFSYLRGLNFSSWGRLSSSEGKDLEGWGEHEQKAEQDVFIQT